MNSIKITAWNVNSVNARLSNIIEYCANSATKPDVLLLQEIKCIKENFPREEFEKLGYNIEIYGQKSYNGVAILSTYQITDIQFRTFANSLEEARYIEGLIEWNGNCTIVASVYVPNGSPVGSERFYNKLKFIRELGSYIKEKFLNSTESFIIGGDFNVAPEEIDVYDPVTLSKSTGFHIDERTEMRNILNNGFIDLWRMINLEERCYSWWDYRDRTSYTNNRGMRIDHIIANPSAAQKITKCQIDVEERTKDRPSDHAPVTCTIKETNV